MKRRLYIFSIWIATMGMLLSTVMLHHHHYERICMVVEVCSQDGSLNDEHTEHHDTENKDLQMMGIKKLLTADSTTRFLTMK